MLRGRNLSHLMSWGVKGSEMPFGPGCHWRSTISRNEHELSPRARLGRKEKETIHSESFVTGMGWVGVRA